MPVIPNKRYVIVTAISWSQGSNKTDTGKRKSTLLSSLLDCLPSDTVYMRWQGNIGSRLPLMYTKHALGYQSSAIT